MFGPFSEAESTVRAHKTSGSANFEATMELLNQMEGPPPQLDKLYLLGTRESFSRLEEIIISTDQLAQPFTQAMTSWYVAAHSKDEFAPVSWTWEQMGFTCKSNLVVYSPTTL